MAAGEAPFTVAAVQAAPVFLDRDRTVEKACALIADAAKAGAKIIVFPEAFIPAYPDWVWVLQPGRDNHLHRYLYGELLDQSVDVPGPVTNRLGEAARKAGAYVAIGVNERNAEASGASIYNTLVYIGPDGSLLGKHRKVMPTSAERMVWAAGDGSTLEVHDTAYGKLGGLLCWENYMPLARYAMYAAGTQLLAAPTWDSSDGWVATLRHIGREGRCFVIGCCIAMRLSDIPDRYEFKSLYGGDDQWINGGSSAIVNPDGYIVAGPSVNEETILYADIDPGKTREAKFWFDAAGHYARPDVFQLTVNRQPNPMINSAVIANDTVDGTPAAKSRAKTARSRR
jgi:nitrilase